MEQDKLLFYFSQRRNNKGSDQTVQAGLGLCSSHATKSDFLTLRPIYEKNKFRQANSWWKKLHCKAAARLISLASEKTVFQHLHSKFKNFRQDLFSRNFQSAKFRENKTLAKWRNHSVVY